MSEHSSPGNEHWLELANELEREHNIYLSQYGSFACKETRAKLEQRLWDDKQTFIQALRAPAQRTPACLITDAMCEAAIDAEDAIIDRIQGFTYNSRHVIRDVRMPMQEQELWSAPKSDPDAYQAFQKRVQVERMRRVLAAALALPSTERHCEFCHVPMSSADCCDSEFESKGCPHSSPERKTP